MLRTLEETCSSRWKDERNKLMYAYNYTKHSVTEYSQTTCYSAENQDHRLTSF